jgi:hypothetical protein
MAAGEEGRERGDLRKPQFVDGAGDGLEGGVGPAITHARHQEVVGGPPEVSVQEAHVWIRIEEDDVGASRFAQQTDHGTRASDHGVEVTHESGRSHRVSTAQAKILEVRLRVTGEE